MGFRYDTIVPSSIDEETYIDPDNLESSLCTLATIKADQIAEMNPDALVLGADTIVVQGNTVFNKPADSEDARRMLRHLSGKQHTVMTGVALVCKSEAFCRSFVSRTSVFFRDISDEEIEWYLGIGEYKDKAGAYAIQGKALIFVDKIEGCFYNVVGLPVSGTINLFKEFIARKESADV